LPEQQNNLIFTEMMKKAIKDLKKVENYCTPSLKLKYVVKCNHSASLIFKHFAGTKKDMDAGSDVLSNLFTYIIIKGSIQRLMQHIRYIELFKYDIQNNCGMEACAEN
jgi:hypothetical protein